MDASVRPARPSDKEPLMSFIRNVWGGHDYIPHVWDIWLRDESAPMFVVEAGGVPVGMNRISFLRDGSAWFQGIRVHPAHRGKGLAAMLGENSMKVAKERGVQVFRLTTSSRNYASRRHTARLKFAEIARFSVYAPPRRLGKVASIEKAAPGDLREVARLIRSSREFRLGRGLYWHDFATTSITQEVLTDLILEGAVWRLGDAVAIAGTGGEGYETWEEVSFVGGPTGDAIRLAKSLFGRVSRADARWLFVPQGSALIPALRREGFTREFSQIVFERTATKG